MESVDTKLTCACKGIRSCGICETIKSPPNSAINETCLIFHYKSSTKCAVKSEGKDVHTFPFNGVVIVNDFVTEEEENNILDGIYSSEWKPSQSGRHKQDFGPKANFKRKKVKMGNFNGLPKYIEPVVKRFKTVDNLESFLTVELCNLEYTPERGSSIDAHYDDFWLWGERLVSLNLVSDTWLTMTKGEYDDTAKVTAQNQNGENVEFNSNYVYVKIPLKRRSLVILFGEARYNWKHQIFRKDIINRRICCTFRELSDIFLTGASQEEGTKLLSIASNFNGTVAT